MSTVVAQLDKSLDTALSEGHGTITIRVVVLAKTLSPGSASSAADDAPVDAAPDEVLPDTDKRPISTFLEEPKRGRQCCVFLINGQRQHAWDNQFVVRDLELKYLRNRMIVVIDCDGLKPEAIAELMQGSRHQFYEGNVYSAVESRVVATLKGDPDLRRLEEEAEDEISSLQAGDEAVKAALDQLIEAHHDAGAHTHHGQTQTGAESRQEGATGGLVQSQDVVLAGDATVGTEGSEPVLNLRPDIAAIRLKPNEARRITLYAKPETAWKILESIVVTFDPPLKELQVARTSQITGEDVELKFVEPEEFDEDEYPIDTVLRVIAMFKGYPERRLIERRVVVNPPKKPERRPSPPLKDDPTLIKVTSRQPIKIVIGGPDVHIRLRWDGKDELVVGNPPPWVFRASCESSSVEPQIFLTRPINGRFELLVQASPYLKRGEQLKFDVEAIGPGTTLTTAFLADVVEPPSARKVTSKVVGGGQRRPPYDLRYVTKDNWGEETCWGSGWSAAEPGSFEEPSAKSPLTIFVNQDMELLATYREALIAKRQAETTIQQRINKYTTHIAFHLYQMYEKKKEVEAQNGEVSEAPNEDQMREEIQRVSRTLIKLMEVSG
ncbi:MAG: hypothetical protein L0Z50_36735 [Verrucomicrobiales bacterium]|nr:hypothetical protein [Verrucomicrobiales bacterium]